MIVAVSVIAGLALAAVYELVWFRMQMWVLTRKKAVALPLAVGGFVLRLLFLGLVRLVLAFWTPLNVLATAVAFVGGFTVLSIVLLHRLAKAKGGTGKSGPVVP